MVGTDFLSEFLRGNKKVVSKVEEFAGLNKILPLTVKTVTISANIQAELRKNGTEIGHADTLIAGIALVGDLQLITNNTKNFKRIKNLEIANWSL